MKITQADGKIYIRSNGREYSIIKELPNARFDRKQKAWVVPQTLELLERLNKFIKLPDALEKERQCLKEKERRINEERLQEDPVPLIEYPVKVNLFKHQIRAANMAMLAFEIGCNSRMTEQKLSLGFGLLFEMGCGKTVTAIAIAGASFQKEKIKRLLVVAPASVVSVWSKEFDEYADFPFIVKTLQGTARKKVYELKSLEAAERYMKTSALSVAVINYESVWRTNEDKPDESVFDTILRWQPDMIICDESQRIKSGTATQSKAMHRLGDTAKYKLILSGTPIQNSAMDVCSQYRFLDTNVFGDNFYRFRARYGVMGGFNGKQVVGVRDIDILTEKAHSIAYRVTKEDAIDLPEQIFENREIEMTSKEQKLYEQVKKECFAEIDGGVISAAMITTRLLRLQQITGGFVQLDNKPSPTQIGTGKLKALEDIIDDYVVDGGKKLVVFARFIPEIHAICAMLDKKKIPDGKGGMKAMRYSRIWGAVPLAERGEQVKQFQTEDDVRVFVAQIDTAGIGITLTAADTAVYYSLNYNYAAYEQSLARIHRIGQKNNCTYIHLVCPKTVDMQILKALHKKEDLAKSIVDNWRIYFE